MENLITWSQKSINTFLVKPIDKISFSLRMNFKIFEQNLLQTKYRNFFFVLLQIHNRFN